MWRSRRRFALASELATVFRARALEVVKLPEVRSATVTPLRSEPGWAQRAAQTVGSLDAERRRRREAAVPVTPKPPPRLGASFRERNVFVLPEDDEEPEG